jgi:uncharacterized membrane protein YebE (DUF533 family)
MDTKALFDSLISAGKQVGSQASDFAQKQIGIPTDGPERSETIKKLGTGALLGGVAALLLGTKSGRRVSGNILKVGTLAALGTIGYKAYQNWQASREASASSSNVDSFNTLTEVAAETRSLNLLRAMIAAAQADGQIDSTEQSLIEERMNTLHLPDDAQQWLKGELTNQRSASSVASLADSTGAAIEMYLASTLIIDEANPAEQRYLEDLRTSLKLEPGLINELRNQIGSDTPQA